MITYFTRQIDAAPVLILIIWVIGLHILNSGLGVYLAFKPSRAIRKLHKTVYFGILILLMAFFLKNYFKGITGFMEYVVLAYYMILIPISKSWDVRVHAFIATIGLTLLPLLILLQAPLVPLNYNE